ncbi:hypothetical protein [Kordiimonas pumila]|uniref:Uncharacterized protein n=1 Tax=Kordiimonas pumila TaxID=2161677 RepID=A0ABV7D2Z4_9PROT|nr:hypothetical protein [Kordiimonas pumila]
MIRDNMRHGFSEQQWNAAKEEMRHLLINTAKNLQMITYSDLVHQTQTIKLDPHDVRLAHMLGEISSEEDKKDRGLLTVIVVHKHGDMEPGPGFYELAKSKGRDISDKQKCWIDELHKVHAIWKQ